MKVAIVHELLTMKGGAEQVARIFADMFPEAPVYTLLYDEQKLGEWFPKDRVRTSSIQPSAVGSLNHHRYLRKFPKAVESWDFSEYDVVLSSSSAFAHGIRTPGKTKHLCYVHSPARYLWDRTHDVQKRASTGVLGFAKKKYLERTFHKLRIWDAENAPRPDKLLAASKEVQRRIELYWRRESEVLYPPIADVFLEQKSDGENASKPHLLIVSTLTPYKRIDIAVEACNETRIPLKIIGEGPDKERLQQLAGDHIEFLGYKTQEEVAQYYKDANAVIFPGHEDFGLVPVEAMSQGTPVIAYRGGGALETVTEGETGFFFNEPTSTSLIDLLNKFITQEQNMYSVETCIDKAKQFSRSAFEKQIHHHINTL